MCHVGSTLSIIISASMSKASIVKVNVLLPSVNNKISYFIAAPLPCCRWREVGISDSGLVLSDLLHQNKFHSSC